MRDIFGVLKNAMGFSQDEDYEDDYQDEQESSYSTGKSTAYFEDRITRSDVGSDKKYSGREKVVPMPSDLGDMKVVVLSPSKYDDARIVCDNLKEWSPVIVKLDKLKQDEAQRVVDFISGACYNMDGRIQEIKDDVFLIVPSMIGIEKSQGESETRTSSFFGKFSVK